MTRLRFIVLFFFVFTLLTSAGNYSIAAKKGHYQDDYRFDENPMNSHLDQRRLHMTCPLFIEDVLQNNPVDEVAMTEFGLDSLFATYNAKIEYFRTSEDCNVHPGKPASARLKSWRSSARAWVDHKGNKYATWEDKSAKKSDAIPVLMLHGFPSGSFDWDQVWERMKGKHDLHAIDFLGYGFSDKPVHETYTSMAAADRVVEWAVDGLKLKGKKVRILSHDLANTAVQELMARQIEGRLPFEIVSVVFTNGGIFPESHFTNAGALVRTSFVGPVMAMTFTVEKWMAAIPHILGEKYRPANLNRLTSATDPEPQMEAETLKQQIRDLWWQLIYNKGDHVIAKQNVYMMERRNNRQRWVEKALIHQYALAKEGSKRRIPFTYVVGAMDPISGLKKDDPSRGMIPRFRELFAESPFFQENNFEKAVSMKVLPKVGHWPNVEDPDAVSEAALEFFSFH